MNFVAARSQVANRGVPPVSFLMQLVEFGKIAPDDIFLPSPHRADEVYSAVHAALGPWDGPRHRRAVMLEVLRVLAGYEADWHWNEGTDTSADAAAAKQHKMRVPIQIEAGAFQVSADSMNLAPELKMLVYKRVGSLSAIDFQRAMKNDHFLAMEYIARLLRYTTTQNGPVVRHKDEIDKWLRRDAVEEFRKLFYPITPAIRDVPHFPH